MNKIRDFIEKNHSSLLIAVQMLFSLAIGLGVIFYTQANVIVYRLWKIVLIDMDFVISCGVLFAVAFYEKQPESKAWYLLFPFLIGSGIFAGLFFGVQAILNHYVNRTLSCVVGISVALAFDLACVIVQNFYATRRTHKHVLWVTTAIALIIYVTSLLLSFLTLPRGWLFKSFSQDEHTFDSASAEEYAITDADRKVGKEWMTTHLTGEEIDPAFDFALDGKRFSESKSEWTLCFDKVEESAAGDVTFQRGFYHAEKTIMVSLTGAYYAETATIEWKTEIVNEGEENSPVLSDFYALDSSLSLKAPTLYFSGGSNERNDDFALYTRELVSHPYTFDTVNGRTSKLYLPFFNIVGSDGGATIGIGWSGNWTATFSADDAVSVRVGQSELCGYLEAGESVRSPLVSLCLYGGKNPMKGFNNFRADIKRGLPDGYKEGHTFLFVAGAEGQDNMSRANADGTMEYVSKLEELGVMQYVDYAWYDAGWFDTKGTGNWQTSIGDWIVDTSKYPDGFNAISTYLEEHGAGSLLWYESERVPKTSDIAKELLADPQRADWLISVDGSENYLWNMGDEEARAFLFDRIVTSLEENGVSYYRQDYNIDPQAYWEKADEELYGGRKGFAENKYVEGEYLYLDGLLAKGYLIDNCASGGRRIDLEMCRRSIPLWRSDYPCHKEVTDLSEAIQYEQYGLGLWLPYSAVTNLTPTSEYDLRSLLGGCMMINADSMYSLEGEFVKFMQEYESIEEYFSENYYPLTSCTPLSDFVAMQYGTDAEGVIVLYSREGSKGEKTLVMNGLSRECNYTIRTIEGQEIGRKSGAALMRDGFSMQTEEKQAYILLYKKD